MDDEPVPRGMSVLDEPKEDDFEVALPEVD